MSLTLTDTIGGVPADQQTISPARALSKWNHNLRGIEIIQLGSTFPGMEVHCIESYLDFFVAGHTYIRSPANDRWLDTTQKIHQHTAETDEQGGIYRNILYGNYGEFIFNDYDPMRTGDWHKDTQDEPNNGSFYQTESSVVLDTNLVAGTYCQLSNGGNRASFEHDIILAFKYELITAASKYTSFRGGVNTEAVWETSNIRRQFGVEWCDDAGQDRTYMLFSGDGSERNAVVTSKSANNDSNTVRSFTLNFIPNTVIKLTWEGDNVLVTKGSTIPRTLYTSASWRIRFGFKNNEAARKEYRIRSCRFIGKFENVLDPW